MFSMKKSFCSIGLVPEKFETTDEYTIIAGVSGGHVCLKKLY